MTREDVKYFANCLKSDKRIDYNTMVDFCNEVIESQNKLQKIENMMTREEETKNKDNNNKEYEKDLNDIKEQILKEGDILVSKRDLLERFCEIDKEYNGRPWNLLQILTNINILIGEEQKWIPITYRKPTQEEKDDYYAQRGEELCYVVENEMPLNGQEVLVSCSGIVSIDTFDEDYYDFEDMSIEYVDAWMPMPKSYKKQKLN